MKKFINDVLASFKANKEGYAARKLSAFIAVLTAMVLSYEYADVTVIIGLVSIWLIFALLLLGIVTFQEIIQLKNGTSTQQENIIEKPQQ
jgi:hypothetical protein